MRRSSGNLAVKFILWFSGSENIVKVCRHRFYLYRGVRMNSCLQILLCYWLLVISGWLSVSPCVEEVFKPPLVELRGEVMESSPPLAGSARDGKAQNGRLPACDGVALRQRSLPLQNHKTKIICGKFHF